MTARGAFAPALFSCSIALFGCSSSAEPDAVVATDQAIIGGTPATAFAEAALIDLDDHRSTCSGAIIAPCVVLTAGHCTRNVSRWTVIVPYAGHQRVTTTRKWTEYVSPIGPFINPSSVDVGLVLLDTPIVLSSYPRIVDAPVAVGTLAVNVGRVHGAAPSDSDLFVGRAVPLAPGAEIERPNAYWTDLVIEPGDSGGPAYLAAAGDRRRTIVAVNSGTGTGTQLLARVDLVKAKIDAVVAKNGGWSSQRVPIDCRPR